jgi:hypothetical protein
MNVQVNPRFGVWDPASAALTPSTYPWLISGTAAGVPAE